MRVGFRDVRRFWNQSTMSIQGLQETMGNNSGKMMQIKSKVG